MEDVKELVLTDKHTELARIMLDALRSLPSPSDAFAVLIVLQMALLCELTRSETQARAITSDIAKEAIRTWAEGCGIRLAS